MKAPALKIVTTYDNLVVLSDLLQDYDDSDFQTDSPQNQKETELENASAPHTPLSPDHEASFDDVENISWGLSISRAFHFWAMVAD